MNASILDLRYKTRKILKALENREQVLVLYHGKPKGMIIPLHGEGCGPVRDHPFFGMRALEKEPVDGAMNRLRGTRHDI